MERIEKNYRIFQYIAIGITVVAFFATFFLELQITFDGWDKLLLTLLGTFVVCMITGLLIPHILMLIGAIVAIRKGPKTSILIYMIITLIVSVVMLGISYVVCYIATIENPQMSKAWMISILFILLSAVQLIVTGIFHSKQSRFENKDYNLGAGKIL